MHFSTSKKLAALLLATMLASPLLLTGCRNSEAAYYNRWEHETHREHVDLARRSAAEQKEYRDWRDRQDHR
jgi:hypothetical protein